MLPCTEGAPPAAQSKKPRPYLKRIYRPEMVQLVLKEMTCRLGKKELAAIFAACGQQFAGHHPDTSASNATRFAQVTLERLENTGSFEDAERSGRPPTISEDESREACELFLAGIQTEPYFIGYTSLKHALIGCDKLLAIKVKHNLTLKGLWKAMKTQRRKDELPPFKKIVLTFKSPLEEVDHEERLKVAEDWLKRGCQALLRFVFIDEKTEYVKVQGSYSCYAPDGEESSTRESPVPLQKGAKVKWLAAVSGLTGPVFFGLTTGTKGYLSHYQVGFFVPVWVLHCAC